jgi:hypothetical protein
MATPMVAGAMALYLGIHPDASPRDVWDALLDASVAEKLSDLRGSPNKLLQVQNFAAGCDESVVPGPHRDCPVSAWTRYGACSEACGPGVALRTRTILANATGCGLCAARRHLESRASCVVDVCQQSEPTTILSSVEDVAHTAVLFEPLRSPHDYDVGCVRTGLQTLPYPTTGACTS